MAGLKIKTFIQKCIEKRNKVIPVESPRLKTITGDSSNFNLESSNLEENPNQKTDGNLFSRNKFKFS